MADSGSQPANPIESQLAREDPSYADLVLEFLDDITGRMDEMDQAIKAGDFDALSIVAHQLKGSGGGYGYPELSERAAELERQAKTEALDDCAKALDELKDLCGRLVVTKDS